MDKSEYLQELEKILIDMVHPSRGITTDEYRRIALDQATQAIKALIHTREQQARVEALEKLIATGTRTYRQTITDSSGNVYLDDTHGYISRYEAQELLATLNKEQE